MYIDIEKSTYHVSMLSENGKIYTLSPAVVRFQWQEEANQLAQQVKLVLANIKVDDVWLMSIVKLGCTLYITADCGSMNHHIFTGRIWEWDYDSSQKKEISLTAYDPMKYLQQSYDYGYYSAGQTTENLLAMICKEWGVPLYYWWGQSIVHEKKVFNNVAISDMILEILEEVKAKTGVSYVCIWDDDMLVVKDFATDGEIFFIGEHCTINTSHNVSINNLVTKVKVIGNSDDDGRRPVEAVLDGDQSFGVLQKILLRDADKTVADVTVEAKNYLKEHGLPEETVSLSCIDIPFLRKGYRVQVAAGDLNGVFDVLGVSHFADSKTMKLSLKKVTI